MKEYIQEDLNKFTGNSIFSRRSYVALVNPRMWPMVLVRLSYFLAKNGFGAVARIVSLLNQILFGCDIARKATIDGGLYLPHPAGVVIGEHVRIGKECVIHQGVTLGARGEEHELSNPTIGNFVEIGTGAKILGNITIGDYGRIGANAVVLSDIPPKGVAVGIPAKVVSFRKDV